MGSIQEWYPHNFTECMLHTGQIYIIQELVSTLLTHYIGDINYAEAGKFTNGYSSTGQIFDVTHHSTRCLQPSLPERDRGGF